MKINRIQRLLIILLVILFSNSGNWMSSTHNYILNAQTKTDTKAKAVAKPKKNVKKTKKKKKKKKKVRKFALNFKDVEISEFLNIMGQLIGKNIILDDKVKGKITISSARKVPVSQAYAVMKSILEIKGLAVVESANLIKIVPIKDAVKKNVEVIVDGKKVSKDKTITFLLEIKNADAHDISNTLKPLKSKNTDIVVYLPLNTIIFSGNSTEINGLIEIAKALDKEIEDGLEKIDYKGNIHVVHLENANADDLANVLSRIPFSDKAKINTSPIKRTNVRSSKKSKRIKKTQAISSRSKQKLSIVANKETNSLIITATPEEFREIIRIIKELDIVREQVLIEALIVEVGTTNGFEFGINWMLGAQQGAHGIAGSNLGGAINTEISPIFGNTPPLPLNPGFQLGYIYDGAMLGFAMLNATAMDDSFNVISTPQILTVDNQEAELNVGQEIPIQSNTRVSDSGTSYYTWEYKTVGIKLKLTPHITQKKQITLDLYQEANQILSAGDSTGKPPTLAKRDIKTKVTIHDGKTIVIGGLISNDKLVSETKVPVLGDIPLLGWLFKHKKVTYRKTNLLVFITPHIVTKQHKIDAITREKRKIQHRLKNR